MFERCFAWFLVLAFALTPTLPAFSQQPSREREALRRSQQQNATLQQDNAALEREKTDLDAKLKAAEADLGKYKAQALRLRKVTGSLEVAEKDKADLKAKLGAVEDRLKETAQKDQEQIATLRRELALTQTSLADSRQQGEQQMGKLQSFLEREARRATSCEEKNQQLYSVTMDLIGKYKANRGAWERFLLSEPFTGLKSAQVENLLEDLKERADEAHAISR